MSIIDGTNFPSSVDLIFYLDAVNTKSYPGSGSTWYDVTGNNNHFTLFNTPTYTQNGTTGTYLTFNGTNQYARSTNAINFNAYSAITLEIGYRSTVTNTSQILYETTGTGSSTATGGITLLMNSNGTSTVANSYLSTWQGYGVRAFGYTVSTNSTFNSIIETFVNGVNTTGRQAYVNGTTAQFFTNTAVTVFTSATTAGLSFANTWTYVASRAGTGNFFRGDIIYVRAWGKKLDASDITTNSIGTFIRQPSSYQNSTILTADPTMIQPPIYAFTNATFTPGGTTEQTGPVLATAKTGLSGTGVSVWKDNTEYFNTISGVQVWTVAETASYQITAAGGQGGGASGAGGAIVRATFTLTVGEKLYIIVGQTGTSSSCGGGGGGGTYVARTGSSFGANAVAWAGGITMYPLLVGGGGGGQRDSGSDGPQTGSMGTYGTYETGTVASNDGLGGPASGSSPGAGGWSTNGGNGNTGVQNASDTGRSFVNGGQGGNNNRSPGKFGGGSGATCEICNTAANAGNGGGYSGGGARSTVAACYTGGGGGGSFIHSTAIGTPATSNGTWGSLGNSSPHSVYSGAVTSIGNFNVSGAGYVIITKL